MNIKDIYAVLAQHGFVTSQVQFSEVWLGRSKRYYSSLVAKGREPSAGTMIALAVRLRNVGDAMAATRPELGHPLSTLGDDLLVQVQHESVVRVRRRSEPGV